MLNSDFMDLQNKVTKMNYDTLAYKLISTRRLTANNKKLVNQLKQSDSFYKKMDFEEAIISLNGKIFNVLHQLNSNNYFEI